MDEESVKATSEDEEPVKATAAVQATMPCRSQISNFNWMVASYT